MPLTTTVKVLNDTYNVTRSEKTDHLHTSEMHFVAPYYRYIHTLSKHSDKNLSDNMRWPILLFQLFLGKNEKPVKMVRDL